MDDLPAPLTVALLATVMYAAGFAIAGCLAPLMAWVGEKFIALHLDIFKHEARKREARS